MQKKKHVIPPRRDYQEVLWQSSHTSQSGDCSTALPTAMQRYMQKKLKFEHRVHCVIDNIKLNRILGHGWRRELT